MAHTFNQLMDISIWERTLSACHDALKHPPLVATTGLTIGEASAVFNHVAAVVAILKKRRLAKEKEEAKRRSEASAGGRAAGDTGKPNQSKE